MKESIHKAIVRRLLDRIDVLSTISSDNDGLTRIFLSKEMDTAAKLLRLWMNNAGLVASVDPLQNVVGSWPSEGAKAPAIHIGSHYDTVINAGSYDGVLGLLLCIGAVEILQTEGYEPKHHLNVLGFCDEEGVRFHTTFLGSSYLCGTFNMDYVENRDEDGVSMREALKVRGFDADEIKNVNPHIHPEDIFLEAHIEQGPVLEKLNQPLGVVTGIAAQARIQVTVTGKAGHAGTTPFNLRKDALTASSEMFLAIEEALMLIPYALATVGHIKVLPNASNAIPGEVSFSIDLRHRDTEGLTTLQEQIDQRLKLIAKKREMKYRSACIQKTDGIWCDKQVQDKLELAVSKFQDKVPRILSGAGHDTLKIAQTCRTGMLFIRCRDGLSHHPDEYSSPEDIEAALLSLTEAIRQIDQDFPEK